MATPISRVLVVYKKSAYQLYALERRDPPLLRLLHKRHPDVLDIRQAHRVHQDTLESVVRAIKRAGLKAELVYRADLPAPPVCRPGDGTGRQSEAARQAGLRTSARYDLIISVGGDGTLLQASHVVEGIPVLGVNSDPQRSEAVFCAATKRTFEPLLRRALAGRLHESKLFRLQLWLNGRAREPLALNDVLIAHDDPATMSRYRLKIGSRQEVHKSSGVWVATAAGSSSAILAAGGTRLPWTARHFQYRPRELYEGRLSRYHLTGGVLPMGKAVEVTWLMREGAVFVDGPHVRHPLCFGDRVAVKLSPRHPLRLLGVPRATP